MKIRYILLWVSDQLQKRIKWMNHYPIKRSCTCASTVRISKQNLYKKKKTYKYIYTISIINRNINISWDKTINDICFHSIFRNDWKCKPNNFYCKLLFNRTKTYRINFQNYMLFLCGTKPHNSSWCTLSAGACLKTTFL